MGNSLPILQPVALARPRGAHRFEAFSLKLARRVTLYRFVALQQWVILEASPAVKAFCENPGFVIIGGQQILADFWIRYADRHELVILSETAFEIDAVSETGGTLHMQGLSIRRIESAELLAARAWIDNWRSMLPCLVANRKLLAPSLSESIVRLLSEPKRMADIERQLSSGDPVVVRASLFNLLREGRVSAPELHSQALSLRTMFVAVEAKS
ncbi:hypothetical protein [Caballeronia sp. GAOx1]|uniref:hypothetical protein n=1 Tax=Caballeronia sp. GAOx1 TaxID=2921761 RepID=UPI002028A80E|nr:hypothetical protein [Caballeronia sp. GAOx1]